MKKKRVHLIIEGRVQGVGYRYFCSDAASSAGVTGWVRNLANGNVEVMAEGVLEQLEKFVSACCRGPSMSRVTKVDTEYSEAAVTFDSFSIRQSGFG